MRTLLLGVAACLLAAGGANAASLVNGGFEDGPALNFGTYARGNGPPTGWNALPGLETPDILSNAYAQGGAGFAQSLGAHAGDRYLDTNGASASGGLYQDVTGVAVGSMVTLTYWVSQWAQNSAGTLTASLIGTDAAPQAIVIPFDNTAQTASWTQHTLTGVAQASTVRVQFTGVAPSCCAIGGPGLDDVSLSAGVPEPAAWALMILGFGAAGAALRRGQRRYRLVEGSASEDFVAPDDATALARAAAVADGDFQVWRDGRLVAG